MPLTPLWGFFFASPLSTLLLKPPRERRGEVTVATPWIPGSWSGPPEVRTGLLIPCGHGDMWRGRHDDIQRLFQTNEITGARTPQQAAELLEIAASGDTSFGLDEGGAPTTTTAAANAAGVVQFEAVTHRAFHSRDACEALEGPDNGDVRRVLLDDSLVHLLAGRVKGIRAHGPKAE